MLNRRLQQIENNIDKYFYTNYKLFSDKEITNWVLDIEVAPVSNDEVLTYSICLMCVDNDNDICFKFDTVEETIKQLLSLTSKTVNIYIHNLYYDFKPFLIEWCNKFNATQNLEQIIEKEVFNPFTKKKEKVNFLNSKIGGLQKESYTYDITFKKGILYQAKFYGELREVKKGLEKPQEIIFRDTLKIMPYSLKKASKDFLDLELSKDGLDYTKKRKLGEKLTISEKKYVYEDVFALKYLVKKLVVEGFYINGKEVKYYKITNSSQSLYDYKLTLLEDYENNNNIFSDKYYKENIDTLLMETKFYNTDKENLKADLLFKKVFPPLSYFEDSWIRKSYYGGLSMVDFDNVKKWSKEENKIGQVFDVNSLYPYIMLDRLLPVGRGVYKDKPYKYMNKKYKEQYPLYIQEVYIYDMKLKNNKTPFVQVKGRSDFNGREIIKENINKFGEKVPLRLVLCNPLLDLLFDNYNVNGFELGGHFGFKGKKDVFKNYLDFWGEIKKSSTGCNRAIAKLRQNGLYGKFGTNGEGELVYIYVDENKWKTASTYENYQGDTIYLPMATFITSWAKKYLVDNINHNRDRFLYCDTDSLHVFGKLEDIKGLEIDDKKYGAWKNEMTFSDFKYLGAKRYAELNKSTGQWEIKCCGLTNEIMKSIYDISTFELCEYSFKELKKVKLYTIKDDVYYYKDKECTQRVKGLFKSKKAKIVKNGTLILEQPYMLTNNPFSY